ncbi:hypothetical protein D9M69_397390 [compost metagenome]
MGLLARLKLSDRVLDLLVDANERPQTIDVVELGLENGSTCVIALVCGPKAEQAGELLRNLKLKGENNMAKTYAVCRINGLIELNDRHPGEGYYALAVGEQSVLYPVLMETADIADADTVALRVPATSDDASPRANLSAIARYIQALARRDVPGVRALGV